MPAISVIMLTYNREGFVERAARSVLEQTFKDFELILVDNGSTDGSGAICDKVAKEDSRVKVVHKEKGNIGSGRNAGLDMAQGDYVAFVDDDDYCMPDFLEFLYGLAQKNDADIATCGSYKSEGEKLEANGNYLYEGEYVMDASQAIEKYLWRQLYNCAMPTKMMKRELFDNIRFSDTGAYDDISTTYKYFANAKKIVSNGKPQYVFYRHPGNNSSAATKHHLLNENQLTEYLNAFRERTKYIARTLPEMEELALYSEWSYMISMVEKIRRFRLTNCDGSLAFMVKELRNHKEEFLNGKFILDFEKQWYEEYISKEE